MATESEVKAQKELADETDRIVASTNKIKTNISDIEDSQSSLSQVLSDMRGKLNEIANVFGAATVFDGLSNIAKEAWKMDRDFNHLSVQMGKAAKTSAGELKKTTTDLMKNFGASSEAAKDIVQTLGEKSYSGNLAEAATSSFLFAKATDQSFESITALTDQLNKFGGLNDKQIKSMYATMVKVQQNNGISKQGMAVLADQIGKSAENMRMFGKSANEIEKMTANAAKLVSSFEKVGIAASTALSYVDRLTDPERIEENIGLYNQLGVSMQDALSGGDITGQLESGLKTFGEKVKQMGPIAGAQYAKAFGISYRDAIKATEAQSVAGEAVGENDAQKELAEGAKAIGSMGEKIEKIGKQTKGWLMKMPALLLSISNFLFFRSETFFKKTKKDLNELKASTITEIEAAVGSIQQAIQKNKEKIKSQKMTFKDAFFGKREDYEKSIQEIDQLIGGLTSKQRKSLEKDEKKALGSWKERWQLKEKLDKAAAQAEYNAIAENQILQDDLSARNLQNKLKAIEEQMKTASEAEKVFLLNEQNILKNQIDIISQNAKEMFSGLDKEARENILKSLDEELNKQTQIINELYKKQELQRKSSAKNIKELVNEKKYYDAVLNDQRASKMEQAEAYSKLQQINKVIEEQRNKTKDAKKEFEKANEKLQEMRKNASGVSKEINNAAKASSGIKGGIDNAEGEGKKLASKTSAGALSKILGKIGGNITSIFGLIQDPSRAITQLVTTVISKLGPWGLLIAVALKAIVPMLQKYVLPILKELGGAVMELLRVIMYPLFKLLKIVLKPIQWISKGISMLVEWIRKVFHISKEDTGEKEETAGGSEIESEDSGPEIYTAGRKVSGKATGFPSSAGSKEIAKKTADETKTVKEKAEKDKEARQKEEEQKLMQNQAKMVFDIRKALNDVFGHTISGFGAPAINVNIAGMDGLNPMAGITQNIISKNQKSTSSNG